MTTNTNHTPAKGEQIYYTGDMANQEGFGVIRSVRTDKWGTHLEVVLEAQISEFGPEYSLEERVFTVSPASFQPGPGRRFWRLEEYRQDRAERIAAMTGEPVDVVLEKMARVREEGGKN